MRISRNAVAAGAILAGTAAVLAISRLVPQRRIDGHCVLVTGGSRGLGLAIALECARRGADIAICARNSEALEAAAEQIRACGAAVLPIGCDIRDGAAVRDMVGARCAAVRAYRRTREQCGNYSGSACVSR